MKKIIATIAAFAMVFALCSCGRSADSEPAEVQPSAVTTAATAAETAAVTTALQSEPTTTAKSETNTPENTTTAETTTTTVSEVVTTTAEPTTTEAASTTAKTTTKAETTTKAQTTTIAKKTTTTNKKDDSQYKITGILASYDRFRRNCPTKDDLIAIQDDIIQYAYDKYNGKSGKLEFNSDGPDAEALKYFGVDPTRSLETLNVPDALTLTTNKQLDFEYAHYNAYIASSYLWSESWGESDEKLYWEARSFRSLCYGVVDYGMYGLLCETDSFPEIEFSIYVLISDYDYSIWFVNN